MFVQLTIPLICLLQTSLSLEETPYWSCPGFVDRFVKSEERNEVPTEFVPHRSLYPILIDRPILPDDTDRFITV